MAHTAEETSRRKGGVPRGLSLSGPILFSYGFRPFFLGGAIWAGVAMVLWISALSGGIDIGGDYGARAWHAHEMLFGFTSAIVAGFLLTAVPNWTGRLPVSGPPLMLLFILWSAGRLALLAPDILGLLPSVLLEATFLPAMLVVCLREIAAGRKWGELRVIAGLAALTLANVCFHFEAIGADGPDYSVRLALAGLTMMIIVVGGRIVPSFTRNWLSKVGKKEFPVPYNKFDVAAILLTIPAFALWIVSPEGWLTAGAAMLAAVLHGIRLWRWRGWMTIGEPLVLVLHTAYFLVPIGLAAIAVAALEILDQTSAIHVLTVGTVTTMMLAVMTRATRGHTGRELTASLPTCGCYVSIFLCASVRPLAAFFPDQLALVYSAAAALWVISFALFLAEYGPMLVARRKPSARAA